MPFLPSRISKQPTFTSGYNGLLQPRINYGFNPANFRMRNTIEKTGQQFHHADTHLPSNDIWLRDYYTKDGKLIVTLKEDQLKHHTLTADGRGGKKRSSRTRTTRKTRKRSARRHRRTNNRRHRRNVKK